MSDNSYYARQNNVYGHIVRITVHQGHLYGLDLLAGLCEANEMEPQASALRGAAEALCLPLFDVSDSGVSRACYETVKNLKRMGNSEDELALALIGASKDTGIDAVRLAKKLNKDWFQGEYTLELLGFDPAVSDEGVFPYPRNNLESTQLASKHFARFQELLPSVSAAISSMRDAPLDWGAEAEVALKMAKILCRLAEVDLHMGSEPVDFITRTDIMGGVHSPFYAIVLPSKNGESVALSGMGKRGSGLKTSKALSGALRVESLDIALKWASKIGGAYAIVELTLAAMEMRHGNSVNPLGQGEEWASVVGASLARSEKLILDHELSGLAPIEEAFAGMSTDCWAAECHQGLLAPLKEHGASFAFTPS